MSKELTVIPGRAPVAATVEALQATLARRGIAVFAVIDHAAGAASVDLELGDEVVVIFGNPTVGTPLMQADPQVGIELPLRMLIWDDKGTTCIGFEDPQALASRFDVPTVAPQLDGMADLLAQLAVEVARPMGSST